MSDDIQDDLVCPHTGEPKDLCACEACARPPEVASPPPKPIALLKAPQSAPASTTAPADAAGAAVTGEVIARAPKSRKQIEAKARNLEVVQRMDRKLRERNVSTMLAITRAPEIDPEMPKPEGWTDRDFRIACAAWKSTRECPSFITIAEKTYSTLVRAEALRDHDPSPQLNCDIQVFVQQNTYNYESVEGDEHK